MRIIYFLLHVPMCIVWLIALVLESLCKSVGEAFCNLKLFIDRMGDEK